MEWEAIVKAIQDEIRIVRDKYIINNRIIRDDVFGILEQHCTVLYHPIKDEKNCGFHIKKIVKDHLEDFVYINTAKPLEIQVFTAAHELGHIWDVAKHVREKLECNITLNNVTDEDITNRFAAELLMPKNLFVKSFWERMKVVKVENSTVKEEDLIKVIAVVMNDFMVPFDAVRKRLFETDIIGENVKDYLKKNQVEISKRIVIYSQEQNSRLESYTMRNAIPGIRILIEEAEKGDLLNIYSLNKIKKDFGIKEVTVADKPLKLNRGEKEDEKDGSNS